ncbi:gamma-tubulin complex component 2 [Selaginella moellendorffii]|uniref:gamma-tubulin complex component 2 n=1 Tax=Selaginella moellendorffii TaxID=88036 RepID=UPI000D1C274D|nr:gamma-tubulin complex component 2 [Selaginella moellendorffii]|eukprot:XP_024522183.1 gamma-tubulin complex component 2 [Selaginella moellendorffii]
MEGDPASAPRVKELLHDLVSICRSSSDAASVPLLTDHVISDSGELLPSLQKLSGQIVPMIQLYQEKRQLLAASPFPQKLIEKIEQLKDGGAHGLDRYLWLVSQILADPDLKKLVSLDRATGERHRPSLGDFESPAPTLPSVEQRITRSGRENRDASVTANGVAKSLKNLSIPDSTQTQPTKPSKHVKKAKPLIEGVSFPATPRWNIDRPYLTGQFVYEEEVVEYSKSLIKGIITERDALSNDGDRAIGLFAPSVQELLVIDDLLFAMVGIEGKSIRITREKSRDKALTFQVDPSMDLSIQELTKRVLPLCENYMVVSQFNESRLQFKYGLVNHAFAAALRAILQDYHAMVAQLEHQFRLARLSLQGLWFFCQPMMGAMQALAVVVRKAFVKSLSGAAVLNLLQGQAAAIAGDNAARTLLQKLTQAASAPYFGILERWIHEGVIDDPYGEFFIDENKALQKESLSHDFNATYWQQRYSLKNDVPGFLASAAENILTTGKYLDAIRECGQNVRIPFSEDAKLTNSGSKRHYLDKINVAYNFASAELLSLIVRKFDLMGRLRSVKHYFLLDQGDFLVHFMDIAKEELAKRPVALSLEKLQSLLELALRTSVAASDPYHEDLTCSLERSSLMVQLRSFMKNGILKIDSPLESNSEPGSMTGLETFTLDYKTRWPLSLVISRKALTKYQLIFRHLFHCKHVERQLSGTWQAHQATRGLDFVGHSISRSYVLCQQMLHFMQSFEHYMTFEVLEPNWHVMDTKLQSAKSIDEVIQLHDFFLDKCLKECILLWPHILKSVEKLKSLCLQYAIAIQWLIPSLYTLESPAETKKTKRCRGQRLRMVKDGEDANFKNTIGQMENDFRKEMKELLSLLSSSSQTEPYLAHLAQGLQGQH